MPFNVMIQLCKITRASKLFQRNFYLPLLKPLSPKDALRRYIITGKNLLGQRIEHYIPVLEEYQARIIRRKYRQKGRIKKRQRKKPSMKYVMPFLDENMEYHDEFKKLLITKSRGRGQCYTYYVPDKDCTLVFSHRMERAIRDKDITDVVIAQRSEKIVVQLKDGTKITLPLAVYDGQAPFYRGEGWTRKEIEEYHHHGKETMSIARLFEAKEQGVEEWELEMMRMANKRRKKMRGEETADWKQMMAACVEYMDWDKFEEETRQIVEEQHEPVEDEPIPMEVDNMEKTKHVNEKLKAAGEEVLARLPSMPEIPEVIKIMQDGEMTEIAEVSGMSLNLPSSGKQCFVPGQIVKSDEGELFVPGQTVENEQGVTEYTPGFTVVMDNEPTLLPGLVMGDDPQKPMFLPGESTITGNGELQFTETEDDVVKETTPNTGSEPESESEPEPEPEPEPGSKPENAPQGPPPRVRPSARARALARAAKLASAPPPPVKEEKSEEESSEEEEIEEILPLPKREPKKFVYERPKRPQLSQQSQGIRRRERASSRRRQSVVKEAEKIEKQKEKEKEPAVRPPPRKRVIYDSVATSPIEKDIIVQEKERVNNFTRKKVKEESDIDKIRRDIKMKLKQVLDNIKYPAKYTPMEPVQKSERLRELEISIKKGKFFDTDHRKYLIRERYRPLYWPRSFTYRNVFSTVGITRYRVWRSVY